VFNIYNTIYDCPVRAYQGVFEFNDPEYLIKDIRWKFITRKKLLDGIIEQLIGQIIDEFGVSRKYELQFYKRKDLLRLKLEWLLGNKTADLTIQIIERELERMNKEVPTLYKLRKQNATMHRVLSQWSGQDTRTLTVFEYYNLEKDYVKESENQMANQLRVKRGNKPMPKERKQA